MHKAFAQRSLCGSGLPCKSVGTAGRCARASKVARLAPVRAATEEKVDVSTNGIAAAAASPANMMDFEELSQIVKMVHETDIIELELKSKKFTLALRKREALKAAEPVIQMVAAPAVQQMQVAPAPAPAPAPPAAPAPAAAAAPRPAAPPAAKPAGKVEGVEMLSPMAGTFYMRPAPGDPAFVKEGDKVKKGQVVGIIEAMKLMNEIEAEISGEVVKFLIPDKSAVSPGQPILLIKP